MSKNVPGVPSSPVNKHKPMASSFNLSQMVGNFIVSKMLLNMCEEAKIDDQVSYISGIIRGYNDWFTALKLDKDTFEMAVKAVDRSECISTAQGIFKGISEAMKKPLIEIPGIPPTDVRKIIDNLGKGKG